MADVHHRLQIDVVGAERLNDVRKTLTAYNTVIRKVNGQTQQFGKNQDGLTRKQRQFNQAMQNTGYQVQDLAVQLGGGVSATQALGQQLPQLLSSFGALGIGIGAFVAVAAALAPVLLDMGKSIEEIAAASEKASKSLDTYTSSLNNNLGSITNVVKQTGTFNEDLADLDKTLLQIEKRRAFLDMTEQLKALGDFNPDTGWFDFLDYRWERIRDSIGGTNEQAQQLEYRFRDLAKASSLTEMDAALAGIEGQMLRIAGSTDKMNAAQLEAYNQVANARRNIARYEATEEALRARNTNLLKEQVGPAKLVRDYFQDIIDIEGSIGGQLSGLVSNVDAILNNQKLSSEEIAASVASLLTSYDGMELSARERIVIERALSLVMDQQVGTSAAIAENFNRAAAAVSALKASFEGLALQNIIDETQLQVLEAGGDAIDVQIAGLRKAVDLKYEEAMANAKLEEQAAAAAAYRDKAYTELEKQEEILRRRKKIEDEAAAASKAASAATAAAAKDAKERVQETTKALEAFRNNIKATLTPIGKVRAEIDQLEMDYDALRKAKLLDDADVEAYKAKLAELHAELGRLELELSGVTDVVGIFADGITGMFDSLIDGTSTVGDAFKDMLNNILRDIARFLLSQQVQQFSNLLLSALGAASGSGTVTTSPSPVPNAATAISPLARVAVPALPEFAIQPAARRISASAFINSAGTPRTAEAGVVINVNNNNGSQITMAEGQDSMGRKTVDMYIDNRVRTAMANGSMDRTMRATYGLRRIV
ncbi:phage tail length tape measure family protein [Salipiger mangrovisoli]|uniref:Phage tail length tape measure family protein n=1 Tax=Salipiger mangrovisoli TaxID=2865933 RepID=A0ABR9X3W1_9RHOB|nr:phage tail length tape measure family protein [Salipiger mangrovisoli]MBE9638274.1 phage tail length tape measure family protein [Salipiger mangrovisoli]